MSESVNRLSIFEGLHQQYFAMVKQLCLGYMKGDQDAAQDLTQEVFISIWNALDGFRKEASYKTWIYRITVNTCLLHIRDSNKRKPMLELDEVHYLPNSTDIRVESYANLYEAIGTLPELDRLIMMLLLEELTYTEIAVITGMNAVHLRVKIHRIKKKMRQLIQQD
ncbi:MAG TPA: RNA polymerase sigma factor [Flavisolibacter sp.]|jgi:RNA polymerase sigma-70 factor (ECF subfamily)|nr:RNA polymerase sigma factor [Flavisolibacter sp.]